MAATIKDVAKLADVSTATVSRVINGDPRISETTRQRVLDSIAKLNYKVNWIARSLKSNRTRTVGFLTPEIANDFFMTVAQGVENRLRSHGYDMIICNSNESTEEESARIELLLEKCVDGLIIVPSSHRGDHLRFLSEMNMPTVLVDRLVEDFVTDAVLVDNVSGAYRAILHLLKRGYTRFGFIGGTPELTTARERYEGFTRALGEYGVEPDDRYIRFGDFHEESGYELMKELAERRDPPDCVFISNYYMHIGATRYLVQCRRQLSDPIFVASFDDMALSSVTGLPSLTIAQPVMEIGTRAAELLLGRIEEHRIAEHGHEEHRGEEHRREKQHREDYPTGDPAAASDAVSAGARGRSSDSGAEPSGQHLRTPPFPSIERLPTQLVFHEMIESG